MAWPATLRMILRLDLKSRSVSSFPAFNSWLLMVSSAVSESTACTFRNKYFFDLGGNREEVQNGLERTYRH